ncbi:MAG: class I SAM-dependent methyltransferase [Polyangiales bacterium]
MQPGKASRTAVLVCAARAIADQAGLVRDFSDPTALALLPEASRAIVVAHRAGPPNGLRGRFRYELMAARAAMMAVRTVVVDEAVREAGARQVVILGAGLDGRAWRMAELRDATVYEVDHPDTQREKLARVGSLAQQAGDVRFVAVDFTRDDLDEALAKAGHDRTLPTTWIWEGVVMYLTLADIEATLAVVARRSKTGSRLLVLYHAPAFIVHIVGLVVRRVGEPLRSSFEPEAMRTLLAKHTFGVVRDQNMAEIGRAISAAIAEATKPIKHLRLAVAQRV